MKTFQEDILGILMTTSDLHQAYKTKGILLHKVKISYFTSFAIYILLAAPIKINTQYVWFQNSSPSEEHVYQEQSKSGIATNSEGQGGTTGSGR